MDLALRREVLLGTIPSSLSAEAYASVLVSFILYSYFFIVSSLALNLLLISKFMSCFAIHRAPTSSPSKLS